MDKLMDTVDQLSTFIAQTTIGQRQCFNALGKLFWAMVYPAEYDQIVVVKMCVLQLTCCHILNGEQEQVPLSQAVVFIIPELNACGDIFPTCTILYYNIFNHLEDKLFPLITTAQEWDHSHSAWDGCSMFAETLWDWYCFLAGIHSVNKIDAARYQHPPQAWYQGQLTFMPSISYLYIVLVCELFRIHE